MNKKIIKSLFSLLHSKKAKGNLKPEKRPVDFIYKKINHMEFWSNNSYHTAYYYINNFGFDLIAYNNSYTCKKSENSYIIKNGDVIMEIKSPNEPNNKKFNDFLSQHGDTLKSVIIEVDNIELLYKKSLEVNSNIFEKPHFIEDENGKVHQMSILMFGNILYKFIDKKDYNGTFLPGYNTTIEKNSVEYNMDSLKNFLEKPVFKKIDHIGFPQFENEIDNTLKNFYELGFHHFWSVDEKVISSKNTTLASTVITDFDENVKFPIFSPKGKLKKSQIQEFLDYNGGSGAQHIALEVDNILNTVENLKKRGISFLTIPKSYYGFIEDKLEEYKVSLHVDIELIKENQILVDFDQNGFLLQIFTKPVLDRPTLFFEFIQRFKNKGFGEGNFQRLFLAIEEEQKKRGNLI